MLVLALEFSRGAPARDARPSATDNSEGTGTYGVSGRRASSFEAASPEGQPEWSLPQNGRAEARLHDLLDQVTDGLPTGRAPRGS